MPYNYITLTPLFCMLLIGILTSQTSAEPFSDKAPISSAESPFSEEVSQEPISYVEFSDKVSEAPISDAESASSDTVVFRFKYKVHIVNGLPDNSKPLNIHCLSKNDDLGRHTLWKDQEFRFKFTANPFGTQFVCDFNWGTKYLVDVNVFITNVQTKTCKRTGNCFWRATSDGLYFSNHFGDWEKYFHW